MTRIMKTTIAALFGATMLATPALAQSIGNGDNSPANPIAGQTVDPGTTAAVNGNLDAAMGRMTDGSAAATIESMPDVGNVRVVGIGTLDDESKARVDQAMAQSDAQIQKLRSVVGANAAITAELEANGMAASDVIAADVAADGSVIVYTR